MKLRHGAKGLGTSQKPDGIIVPGMDLLREGPIPEKVRELIRQHPGRRYNTLGMKAVPASQ